MTDKPIVIQGVLSDIKLVKTRSVLQLIVEVPVEAGDEVVRGFGYPQPGREINVALARLMPPASSPAVHAPSEAIPGPIEKEAKPKSYAQQAGIMCQEPAFWRYLSMKYGDITESVEDADTAVAWLRRLCGTTSRSYLIEGSSAGDEFRNIRIRYQNWLKDAG